MKEVFTTLGCLLKISSGRFKRVVHQSLMYCRLSSTNPIIVSFPDDQFIGVHDNVNFVELFKGRHHRYTDEYPFSTR